jgi:hypothetical protein
MVLRCAFEPLLGWTRARRYAGGGPDGPLIKGEWCMSSCSRRSDSWGGRLPLLGPEERARNRGLMRELTPPLTPPRTQHAETEGNREQRNSLI